MVSRKETAVYEQADNLIRVWFRIEVYHISYFGPNEPLFVATSKIVSGAQGFYVHPSQNLELEKKKTDEPQGLELTLTHDEGTGEMDKLTRRTLCWPRHLTTVVSEQDDEQDRPEVYHFVMFHASSYVSNPLFNEKDYRALEAASLRAAHHGKRLMFKPEIGRIREKRDPQLVLKF